MDEKILDLETKISFQDHWLQELKDLVFEQQNEIEALTKRLLLLEKKFTEATATQKDADIIDADFEVPPPHY